MEFSHFHFAESRWFWGLILIPILCFLYAHFYRPNPQIGHLENFIDKHLIPHLLKNSKSGQLSATKSVVLGSLVWVLLLCGMASPRWDFKEGPNFKQDRTLLILLDLSKSMDSDDIKPSRLYRARQEIEDLINLNTDIKIGLLGFAADAHIISPITDDMNNIKHLLPLVGTDLIYVQGTRLSPALKTAERMLDEEPGKNKFILIVTDGGFQDEGEASSIAGNLTSKGVVIHTLGIGTEAGAMFVDQDSNYVKRNDKILTSRLEKTKLQNFSRIGRGQYFDTDYSDKNTLEILNQISLHSNLIEEGASSYNNKEWEERFYIFVFPVMLIILFWFRKGFVFPFVALFILASSGNVQAGGISIMDKFFLNKEQQAQKALEEIEDFDTAVKLFEDPYKLGVTHYKSGNFKEAEKYFRRNKRPEAQENSLYNLGNSLVKQNKFSEAIDAYQEVLDKNPDHEKAKHNMGIAKTMLMQAKEKKKEEEKHRPKKNNNDNPGGGGTEDKDGDNESENEKNSGEKSNDKNSNNSNSQDETKKDNDKTKQDGEGDKQNNEDKTPPSEGGDNENSREANSNDSNNRPQKSKTEADNQNAADASLSGAEQEINVDQWLNKISNDHKNFLRNQFYLESQHQNDNTNPNLDPW